MCDVVGDVRCYVFCEDGLWGCGRGIVNYGERGYFYWVFLVCVLCIWGYCVDSCFLFVGDSVGRGVRFRVLIWGMGILSRGMLGWFCVFEVFVFVLWVCLCLKYFRRL